MPVTINSRHNPGAFDFLGDEADALQDSEVKYQISFKFPLVRRFFSDQASLYFAYTNQSWWQLYANDSPFRETNHEPEMFLRFKNDWQVLGLQNTILDFGFAHESNGRSGPLSRSRNRLFANAVFERENFSLA